MTRIRKSVELFIPGEDYDGVDVAPPNTILRIDGVRYVVEAVVDDDYVLLELG